MTSSIRLRRAPAIFGLCSAMFLAFSTQAASLSAQQERQQAQLAYKVYVGGVRMFNVNYDMTIGRRDYRAQMKVKAKGLGKIFANITLIMTSNGSVIKGQPAPQKFSFYNRKKKRKRSSDVFWQGGDFPQTNRTWPISDVKRQSLARARSMRVVDPVTAFLRLGAANASNACAGVRRVYDGSVVYDLAFKSFGWKNFNGGGAFNGQALKCQVTHVPVAGYSQRGLQKARKNPAVFTVWFAPVDFYTLDRKLLLPVAASGRIKGKGFSAVASHLLLDGQPL